MQTTATHELTAAAGSLAKRFIPFYLTEAAEQDEHSKQLLNLFRKRKDGPAREALWTGYWLTSQQAKKNIETLAERGGLLFAGQPRAIQIASALEKERNHREAAVHHANQPVRSAA